MSRSFYLALAAILVAAPILGGCALLLGGDTIAYDPKPKWRGYSLTVQDSPHAYAQRPAPRADR